MRQREKDTHTVTIGMEGLGGRDSGGEKQKDAATGEEGPQAGRGGFLHPPHP